MGDVRLRLTVEKKKQCKIDSRWQVNGLDSSDSIQSKQIAQSYNFLIVLYFALKSELVQS